MPRWVWFSAQRFGNIVAGTVLLLYLGLFLGIPSVILGALPTWYIAAFTLGSIYFFVGLYYFYDKFVLPFQQETRSAPFELSNFLILTLHWCFPMFLVPTFVVLGFWMTIEKSPFERTAYTHAYMYGLIYRHITDAALKPGASELWPSVEPYAKYLDETARPAGPEKQPDGSALRLQGTRPASLPRERQESIESHLNKIPFLIAVSFGFLGALIYTLTDLSRRFYASDLYPKTYVNYVVRFIFAPSLCIVVAIFLQDAWLIALSPILFFFIGHFPDRGMQFIEEKASTYLGAKKKDGKQELPLSLLQGMSDYMIYRFKEIGIDDAQNLALADLDFLRENVGYGNSLLCDFVAQAILLVHLKEYFSRLQGAGIRNVVCFRRVVRRETSGDLAKLLEIPVEVLCAFLEILESQQFRDRLSALESCAMSPEKEQ